MDTLTPWLVPYGFTPNEGHIWLLGVACLVVWGFIAGYVLGGRK